MDLIGILSINNIDFNKITNGIEYYNSLNTTLNYMYNITGTYSNTTYSLSYHNLKGNFDFVNNSFIYNSLSINCNNIIQNTFNIMNDLTYYKDLNITGNSIISAKIINQTTNTNYLNLNVKNIERNTFSEINVIDINKCVYYINNECYKCNNICNNAINIYSNSFSSITSFNLNNNMFSSNSLYSINMLNLNCNNVYDNTFNNCDMLVINAYLIDKNNLFTNVSSLNLIADSLKSIAISDIKKIQIKALCISRCTISNNLCVSFDDCYTISKCNINNNMSALGYIMSNTGNTFTSIIIYDMRNYDVYNCSFNSIAYFNMTCAWNSRNTYVNTTNYTIITQH